MAAHWNYVASGDGCSGADGDNSFVRWLPSGKRFFFVILEDFYNHFISKQF